MRPTASATGGVTLDAADTRAAPRDGQREIACTRIEVEDALAGREGAERDDGSDEEPVGGRVHLRERVGRHLEVEPRLERDAEAWVADDEPAGAGRLGEDRAADGRRAGEERLGRVGVARAGRGVRDRRQHDAARSDGERHAPERDAQRRDPASCGAEVGGERRVGDRAVLDLEQPVRARAVVARPPALDHEREARAVVPVAARGERREDLGVAHACRAGELLGDDRRLRVALRGRRDVLPLAAAAGGEVAAAGEDACGPRLEDLHDAGPGEARTLLHGLGGDPVARRGVGHEHHLAVAVRERVEAVGEPLDREDVSQSRARRARRASPRR